MSLVLGLQSPWQIKTVEFKPEPDDKQLTLHFHIDFAKGKQFRDEEGNDCLVHNTVSRQWRHLNVFEHLCTEN